MIVKTIKFHPNARIPEKAYDKDFCYDVYATSEEEIAPNVWRYGLGLGFQIVRGNEVLIKKEVHEYSNFKVNEIIDVPMEHSPLNLSIDFRPRSSVWKTGMVLSNCEGTIDEGYINETSAVFYHVMSNMPRYRVGDKIGQIKIGITFPIEFKEVTEFAETDRGMRGYGSSGQ